MIRALEYVTRVLFTGGESDLCVQFLYTNLSGLESPLDSPASFPRHLSEEGLNNLLCGEQDRAVRNFYTCEYGRRGAEPCVRRCARDILHGCM